MSSSIAAVVSLTSVPNENWATTSAIEFDDVDWTVSRRGTPAMARSIGLGDLLGDVRRAGARVRRDDGDDREVDVGQELLLEAAPGRDAGDEQGGREQERDAALADGELGLRRLTNGSPLVLVTWCGAPRVGVDGGVEDLDRAVDDGELVGVEPAEQLAHLARG